MAHQRRIVADSEWQGPNRIEYQNEDLKFILIVSYRNPKAFEQFSNEFHRNVENGSAFIRAAYDETTDLNELEDGVDEPGERRQPPPTPGDLDIRIMMADDPEKASPPVIESTFGPDAAPAARPNWEKASPPVIEFTFGEITLGSTHRYCFSACRAKVKASFRTTKVQVELKPDGIPGILFSHSGTRIYPREDRPELAQAMQFRVIVTGESDQTYTLRGNLTKINKQLTEDENVPCR
jgi:hypothetical protein